VEGELAFHRGVVAYGEGRLEEAERHFQAVIAEDAEDAPALQYLGLIAQARGDEEAAVGFLRRAVTADPEETAIRVDLAAALLAANRVDEASEELDRLLAEEPDRGRAQLYAGIADYRRRSYADALAHFQRAVELDPELRLQARYYAGLAEAFLGDLAASGAAFADAEEESPSHPLARSARALRRQVTPGALERRWQASLRAGGEFDSNPTVVGEEILDQDEDGSPVLVSTDEREDFRGVFGARGEIMAFRRWGTSLRAGYDGYFSLHSDETEVDQNTQLGWASVEWLRDPVQLALRYDFAFTWFEFDRRFRSLHRVMPTASLRQGGWGLGQLFYHFQRFEYYTDTIPALNRDGDQHSAGLNQFVFLPEPLSYLRFGALWSRFDSEGDEFAHDAYEMATGLGAKLPWKVEASLLYRFTARDYNDDSIFDLDGNREERDDIAHQLSFDISLPFGSHWEASLAGSFTFNDSDVSTFDYDRQIVSTLLTYSF
jgi:hypothetical protein